MGSSSGSAASLADWKERLGGDAAHRIGVVVILACVWVMCSTPFLALDAPDGVDTEFHINRIRYLAQALAEGSFPARMQSGWANDHIYPISIMYADLFLYPGAGAVLLGMPVTLAYNLTVIVVNAASIVLAYAAAKVMTASRRAALVGTVLWMLCYLRLFDLCPRGAFGELLASTFFPVIACGIYLLFSKQARDAARHPWAWLALGASGVVYAHAISTLMILMIGIPAILVGLIVRHDRRVLANLGIALGATLLLTAAFTVPFLDFYLTVDMRSNSGAGTGGEVTVAEAIAAAGEDAVDPSVYGGAFASMGLRSATIGADGISLPVREFGIPLIAGALLMAVALVVLSRRRLLDRDEIIGAIGCLMGIVLLLLAASRLLPWDAGEGTPWAQALRPLVLLQFPWRLLLPVSYLCSIVAALACAWLARASTRAGEVASAVLVVAALVSGAHSLCTYLDEREPITEGMLVAYADAEQNEVAMAEFAPAPSTRTYRANELWNQQGIESSSLSRSGMVTTFDVTSSDGGSAYVPQFWYKYQVIDDAAFEGSIELFETEEGTIGIRVGPGSHGTVAIRFQPPWFWAAALATTWLAAAGLAVWALREAWASRAGASRQRRAEGGNEHEHDAFDSRTLS